MRRVIGIVRKEILHILRDPRSLAVAILMPAMMMLLFGFAINLELRDLPVGILDMDRSSASRELIRSMTSSGFIVNGGYLSSRSEIEPGFRHNRFQAAIVIPRGYARSLIRNLTTEVQVLIDGTDGATAATVDNYMNAVIAMTNRSSLPRSLASSTGSAYQVFLQPSACQRPLYRTGSGRPGNGDDLRHPDQHHCGAGKGNRHDGADTHRTD